MGKRTSRRPSERFHLCQSSRSSPLQDERVSRLGIENKLDLYVYLTWLLKTASALDLTVPEEVQKLLPWNMPKSI